MAAHRSRIFSASAVGGAVALLLLLLRATGSLEPWELKTQDLRTHWTLPDSPGPVRSDLLLVAITDASIETVHRENKMPFPWDWDVYALFLRACEQGKAGAAAFDLLLREEREGAEDFAAALR